VTSANFPVFDEKAKIDLEKVKNGRLGSKIKK
jgi:hypothetical protein